MVQVDRTVRSPSAIVAIALAVVSVTLAWLGPPPVGVGVLALLVGLIWYVRWQFAEHQRTVAVVSVAAVAIVVIVAYRALAWLVQTDFASRVESALMWLVGHPEMVVGSVLGVALLGIVFTARPLVRRLFPPQGGDDNGVAS